MRTLPLLATLLISSAASATNYEGTLFSNTTWTTADSPVQVVGDLTIPSGVTLTIQPGVQVQMATSDGLGSGTDPSRVELIVADGGTLTAQGTAASGILLTTTGGAGAWYGVEANPGSTVTLTQTIVEKAGTNVTGQGGNVTLAGATLRNASGPGLAVTSGTVSATGSAFVSNGTQNLYLGGGSTTVDHSLISGASSGIYQYGTASVTATHDTIVNNTGYGLFLDPSFNAGSVTLQNNVIANDGSDGIYRYNQTGTFVEDHNLVWGSSTNYSNLSPGTGDLSANPLFASATNFNPTTNSPARLAASDGTDLGAFAYASDPTPKLEGTLFSGGTLSGNLTVVGDLTVPPNVTVTVAAGTTLTFATSDEMAAGTDTSRVELIVNGTLVLQGTAASNVLLTTTGGSGAWYGVEANAGSTVTVSNAILEKAGTDLTVQGGNVTFTNSTLRNASGPGLTTTSGTFSATGSAFVSNGTQNLYLGGGSSTVDHSLISGASSGIYQYGTASVTATHDTIVNNTGYGLFLDPNFNAGSVTLENNIIANDGSDGIYRYNQTGTFVEDHNLVWGSSTNYSNLSPGTGDLSANPLFASATNFNPTTNSPARLAASDGTDLGAFAYANDPTPNLEGTLFSGGTLSGNLTVAGDLTVPPNVTVTVAAGTTLTFATSDDMAAGTDTSRAELIVNGTLVLQGTAASNVLLTTTGGAGAWYGVEANTGSTVTVSNAILEKAGTDLTVQGGNVTFTNSTLRNASGPGLTTTSGTFSATGSAFVSNGTQNLYLGGGSTTVDHSLISGASSGIYQYGTASVTATHDTIVNNTGYGLFLDPNFNAGSATLENNIIANDGSDGIYRYNQTGTFVEDHNDVWGSSTNYSNLSPGTGDLSANPLFVSATNFSLQATSPCRMAASDGSDLGAFPYQVGPLDHIVISPTSATVTAGGQFGFGAQGYDLNNNIVSGLTYTWQATAAAGTITQNGLLTGACTPGTVNNGVTVTASGKSASANITVVVGPASSLGVTPATPNVPAGGTQTFSAQLQDSCGNPVGNATVSWSVPAGAGSITAAGVYTAPCATGSYLVSASSGSANGHATATVTAAQLAHLSVTPSNPSVPEGGQQQFTATGSDSCGNAISANVSWSVVNGGGTVNNTGLFTAGNMVGTFGQSIQASSGGVSGAADVTVTAASIAMLVVTPPSATLGQGAMQTFAVVATDAAGHTVAVTPTWSVVSGGGAIDVAGNFTAGNTAGTFNNTVKAIAGGLTAYATVVVQPGAANHLTISPATATLAPNGMTSFSATVYDANNNVTMVPVTWTVTNAAAGSITAGGVFTAGTAGSYPGTVVASAGAASNTASVTVSAGALSQLLIAPPTATVRAGGTVGFTVTGKDASGNTVAVTPAWAVVAGGGTIDPVSGIFTAGHGLGTFTNTVQVQASGLATTATVLVGAGPVVAVVVDPSHPALLAGATQQFTATATDAFGNTITGSPVTWAAEASAGTIDPNGLFTAGGASGDYPSAVTATVDMIPGTASVQILGADGGFVTDAGGGSPPDGGTTMCSDCTYHAKSGCACNDAAAFAPVALIALGLLARRRRRTQLA